MAELATVKSKVIIKVDGKEIVPEIATKQYALHRTGLKGKIDVAAGATDVSVDFSKSGSIKETYFYAKNADGTDNSSDITIKPITSDGTGDALDVKPMLKLGDLLTGFSYTNADSTNARELFFELITS